MKVEAKLGKQSRAIGSGEEREKEKGEVCVVGARSKYNTYLCKNVFMKPSTMTINMD